MRTCTRGFALAASLTLSVGCGRAATDSDCTKIVDKSVEVQLKKMNRSDEDITKLKAETLEKMKDRIKECVGKRVTDRMMTCVDKASTPEEVDHCMK